MNYHSLEDVGLENLGNKVSLSLAPLLLALEAFSEVVRRSQCGHT